MVPNFEKIKKIYFQIGATKALNEMKKELEKKDNYIYFKHSIEETHKYLLNKYSIKNLLSGEELDEAQQKSE